MSSITRGVRGVFRNPIRTTGVTVILALSIGLALVMLLALKTVQDRITTVKASIGNTISIAPAGFSNFSDANNALSTTDLAKLSSLAHITKVAENITDRLTTIGADQPSFGNNATVQAATNSTTSLTSPVKLNTSGNGGGGGRFFVRGGGQLPANFSLPITVLGTTDPSSLNGTAITISSGQTLDGSKDANSALISTAMASKNNLKVGSTFTAYNAMLTVAGIFTTSSNQGESNTIILTLPTAQRLSSQTGDVTSAMATVDSVDNLAATTTAVKNTLGSSADVTNAQDQVNSTIVPLQSIKTTSTYSLIGALAAGAIIIFLTMLMIVRERRREIGVLKAIGSSSLRIMVQFVSESLTLTAGAAVLGVIGGTLLATPILNTLVNSTATATTGAAAMGGRFAGGGGFGRGFTRALGGGGRALQNLHATVGFEVLLYGLGAALLIAILGSALPAWLIARVRPAEVLRGE